MGLASTQRHFRRPYPQQSAHRGYEFARRHGLGEVGVGAAFETSDRFPSVTSEAESAHENIRMIALDNATYLQSAHVGQLDVEQNEIGLQLARRLYRLLTRGCIGHLISRVAQDAALGVPAGFVVVDVEEDLGGIPDVMTDPREYDRVLP